MPIYVFESEDGDVIERYFPLRRRPRSIRVDGKRFERLIVCVGRKQHAGDLYPMKCDQLDCSPNEVKAMEQLMRDKGVPVRYTERGEAIIESRGQLVKACRARGFFDKKSWGDCSPLTKE